MGIFEITIGQTTQPPSLWTTIFTGIAVALGGGIVLFGLNWFKETMIAKRNRHTDAEVLAFSLASDLDQLVSACYEVADDPQVEDRDTGIWEPTVSTPTLVWGDNFKWSSLPRSLQYRIRALPNMIDAAVKSCAAEEEYGDGPPYYSDYFRERELKFSRIGLEALTLRLALSKSYGVDLLSRGSWDPDQFFRNKIAKIEREKEEMRKPVTNWFLSPKVPMAELERRRAVLGAALDAAQKNFR